MGLGRPSNLPEVRSLFLFRDFDVFVGKELVLFVGDTGLGRFSMAVNILSLTIEEVAKCITASSKNSTRSTIFLFRYIILFLSRRLFC